MDGGTGFRRSNEKTFIKTYKGQEIGESHDHQLLEETWHKEEISYESRFKNNFF